MPCFCYRCGEDLTEKVLELYVSARAVLLPKIAPLEDNAKRLGGKLEVEIESVDVDVKCQRCGAGNKFKLPSLL